MVVLLDEFAQRVTGFAGLADRLDFVLVAAPLLPPLLAVMPNVAVLDLEAGMPAPSIATTKSTS